MPPAITLLPNSCDTPLIDAEVRSQEEVAAARAKLS